MILRRGEKWLHPTLCSVVIFAVIKGNDDYENTLKKMEKVMLDRHFRLYCSFLFGLVLVC